MPTNKPKIAGYVPPAIKEKFVKFCEERSISESQGVTVILAVYFGMETLIEGGTEGITIGGVTPARVEALEQRVEALERQQSTKVEHSSKLLPQEMSEEKSPAQNTTNNLESDSPKSSPENESPRIPPIGSPLFDIPSDLLSTPIHVTLLVKRLDGIDNHQSINNRKNEKSTKNFADWTAQRDLDGIAWKYVDKPVPNYPRSKGGFVPAEEISPEQQEKLSQWLKENNK